MKTLITTLGVLILSLITLSAKDGTFTSVIIPDGGAPLQITLSARQWIKVINFIQNDSDDTMPADLAGVAVFKGDNGLWVLFATKADVSGPDRDVIVSGPATVIVSPPQSDAKANKRGAKVFLTYQRGVD